MAAELAIIAKLQDEASSGIRSLRGEVEGLGTSGELAGKGFASLQAVGTAALAALAAAAVAVGGAIVSSINVAADFESQIAILSTAAGDAGTSLDTLRNAAMAVGADVSLVGVSASGAADAMTILYKAGLTTGEIFGDLNGYLSGNAELSGALRAAIDGAAASELDMAQAAQLAATTLATFGGSMTTTEERAQFVNDALNNFVQTADASVASVADLAAAMQTIGPTAAQFGFSLQDTNTALALLSTRGIAGSEAGTALKSMFVNLMRPTADVKGALAELNVSLYNADGTMRSMPQIIGSLSQALYGMNEVTTIAGGRTAEQNHQLELAQKSYNQATDAIYKHNAGLKVLTDSQLQKYVEQQSAANAEIQRLSAVTGTASTAVAQLTEEQRNQYIATLAGSYGMKAMAVLLMEGTAGWEAMEKAISEAATIQEVAAARTQTFSGAMEALGGVIETIQIGIGSAFLPVLTALAKALAQLASENMQEIVSAFEAVGSALAFFFDAILAGTHPVTAFADAVGQLAEALGMPAEQAALLRDQIEGVLMAIGSVVGPIWEAITSFVSWKDVLAAVGIAIASVVIPALIAIVQFLAPIIATIAAVILAVAALRNAWEADFLGIRSAVEGAVETFGRFVEAIRVLTDENARVQAMADVLAQLPEPLQLLAAAVASFINTLRDGGSLVDAFRAGLETLKQAIFDWAGASDWGDVGSMILDKIAEAFSNLGDRVATTAAGILNWITTSVNSIDWVAVGTAIVNGIAAAITGVVSLLVAGGTAIVNFFSGFFTNDSLQAAGTGIVTALGNAISGAAAGIASGLESIKQAIFDWAGADSWGDVGRTIIDKIAETFRNLGDKVAEVEAGIFNWISDAINGIDWRQVGESIINGIVAAISAVVGLLVSAGTAIVNYFIGFFTNDEIGPAAENLISSLSNAIGELAGGIADGLEKVRDAIFDWAGAEDWSGVAEKILEMIGDALAAADAFIADKMEAVRDAIFDWADAEDWGGVAETIVERIGDALSDAAQAIGDQLASWRDAIFDWADAEDWSGVGQHIAEMVGQALADAATAVWEQLETWEQGIFDWADAADWTGVGLHIAEQVGLALMDAAGAIVDKLGEWEQAIFDWADAGNWIEVGQRIVELAVEGLTEWADAAGEKVEEWFGAISDTIDGIDWYQIGYDIVYFIVNGLAEFGTAVSETVTGWYNSIKTFVEGHTWQEIAQIVIGAIVLGLSNFATEAGTAVTSWHTAIKDKVTTMLASFSELGKSIIEGIASGIASAHSAIVDALVGAANGAIQAAKDALGIHSPSTVAASEIGQPFSQGIALGILQAAGTVIDAIGQLATMVQIEGAKAFGEAMKTLAEGLAAGMNAILDLSAFPGVGGSFLDNLRTVVDMLAEMVAEVAQANVYGEEALGLLGTFVDVAGGIADLILPLIVALTEIGRFQPINPEAFTAAMEQIAAYLAVAVQHVVAANQYSELVLEGLSAFLGVIEQIADTVAPFLAALVDINAFGIVNLDFFHEGIAHLWYTMLMLVGKVQELAVLGTETLARMEGFLEVVQAIADLVGPFIEALYEMNAFGIVNLDFFHEGLAHLAYVMLMVVGALNEANDFGTAALEAVRLFAETAGAIAEMIGPMIEGLISINALDGTMNEVAYHATYFRNGVRALVDALASAAALFTTGTLQHVQQFAETAGAIAEIIVPAVEGLMIIGTLTGDLNYIGIQATYFRNGLRTIVSALESAAELFTAALLNHIQLFAETAGAIMDLVGPAIEGFALISTLTGEVNYIGIQATYLRNGLRTIVTAISSAAELFTAGLLAHTQLFAETAGEIVDLIADAIEALALLANYVAAAGLEAAAAAFAADLTGVVTLIVDALREAGLLANEAITQAVELADGLSDILGLIEDGVDALTALAAYVTLANLIATAQSFAYDLAAAINAIVAGLQQAGVLTSASIAAAAELADGLSDVLGMVEDGVGALAALASYISSANLVATAQQFAADLATVVTAVVTGLQQAGVLANTAIVAAGDLADGLADVLGLVEDGVDALVALAGYVPNANLLPTAQQFAADLAVVITIIVAALQQAGILAGAAIVAAGELAGGLSDVLGMVADGVGALVELANYVPAAGLGALAQRFAVDLAAVLSAVVGALVQAGILANEAVVRAGELSGGLADILSVVADGVAAIQALAEYVSASGIGERAAAFAVDLAAVVLAIVNGLVQAGLLANQAVAAAADLAARLGDLLGVVDQGIEAIRAIAEYQGVAELSTKVQQFTSDLIAVAIILSSQLATAANAIGIGTIDAARAFATAVAALADEVQKALTGLGQLAGMATPNVDGILAYIVASAQQIQASFTAAGDIGQAVAYAEAFRQNLEQLVQEVQAAVAQLNALAGTGTTGTIGAALANIAAALQNTAGQFAGAGTVLAQALITALTAGINAGQGTVMGAMVSVLSATQSAGESAARNFDAVGATVIDATADAVQSGQGQVVAAVNQVIDAAIAAGVAAARAAASIGQQLIQSALTEINNGRSQLDSAGSSAGNALIDGMTRAINSGKSQVVNAIINTVTAAINAAKAALGIASPSKVAIDLLSNFMNTAARTVEGLRGRLADSMAAAVGGAAASAAAGLRGVQLSPAMSPAFVGPALSNSLGERAAFAAVGRGRATEASGANHTQVVFYGNVVLPNVTDSRSFLEELDALRGVS